MAKTQSAYNLSDPSALLPESITSNTSLAAWFYAVFIRIKNGIKFSVNKTADQAIPDDTATKVTWSTTILSDSIGGWDSTNNRYVVQMEGTYTFHAAALLEGAISGGKYFRISLYKNGVATHNVTTIGTSTTSTSAAISAAMDLSPTDYIEVYVHHTVGGSTQLDGTAANTYFQGYRIN